MRSYFLTSRRIGFSTWSADDLPLATALWGDPEVTRYHGGDWSPEEIEDRLALELATFRKHQVQYWPLFLLETGKHIGCCGLHPRDLTHGVWELGCHLRRAFWSQRFGREAAQAAITYGFDTLGAEAIFAGHHPSNTASRDFLRHLGFRHTHDEFYPPTQLVEPCYLLTRPEAATAARG
jgi:[ribosomal protein S5]-alanine N-acetyltransferase